MAIGIEHDASHNALLNTQPLCLIQTRIKTPTGREQRRESGVEIVTVNLVGGRTIHVAIAEDASPTARHQAMIAGTQMSWTGPVGRFGG